MKMDEDQFQTNLNTLKELILDEQKLITYVSLSKDLCIHINDSKRLLFQFLKNTRKEQPNLDLNVCYIISGLTKDNIARTTVTSENEVDNLRKGLGPVFFEHIYSISKGVPSLDSAAFLAVSRFDDFPLCSGLIKSSSCIKRSVDEIGKLKSSSQVLALVECKSSSVPTKKVKEESKDAVQKGNEDSKCITKLNESKSEPSVKSEVTSPKNNSCSSSKFKLENKKNGMKSQKGIAGFFNKSNSAPSKIFSKDIPEFKREITVKKETVEERKNILKEKPEPKLEKMDVDDEINQEVDVQKIEIKPEVKKKQVNGKKETKTEVKKEQVSGKTKSKSLSQIKKTAKVEKKRKRVLHVSDSESDNEKDPFEDEPAVEQQESDDEIPPTPASNTIKITSGILNPKKRRKIIDKTYTDEEGYILTKKVEVYESCSDNEDDAGVKENVKVPPVNQVKQETSPKEKKNTSKNTKKKISPPQKGKQATLMNFFKKV